MEWSKGETTLAGGVSKEALQGPATGIIILQWIQICR